MPPNGGPDQPVAGAIFVSGCDTGMGRVTAERLASKGYRVFAGCFTSAAVDELNKSADKNLSGVPIDVTSDDSVANAARIVAAELKKSSDGLVGVINCSGIACHGPSEYLPMSLFHQQFEVNFFGYVRVAQAFLPLVKAGVKLVGRRGRLVFVGTGGGIPGPSPPILGAYMSSKHAVEAFQQSLRQELRMRGYAIDCCMINPGVIKPTGLKANGKANIERSWAMMPPNARAEYEPMTDSLLNFYDRETGTHVSKVADAMEQAMRAGRPPMRYKVLRLSVGALRFTARVGGF